MNNIALVGQNGNGDGKPVPKICPLGWGLVMLDTSGIIPGGGQQPQQVAPNCVEARCAFWNDDAKACSVAVVALELQNRSDQLEQSYATLQEMGNAIKGLRYGPAPGAGGGKDAEATGNPG